MTLDRRLAGARAHVEKLEPELTAAYEKPLRAAAHGIGARFRARAVTAAVQPRWTPPDPEDLVDGQQVAASAQPETQRIHERALRLVGDAAVGVSFDLQNPFAASLLAGLTSRSGEILAGFGDELQSVIRDAHDQGLSVVDAAKLVQRHALDASTVTARLLARTDLNSIANGGSLMAAQLVDQASVDAGEEGVGGKTWVTAGDERVRPDHADADGQTVPLDQPFDVGGEQLLYPGDPQASLSQIANCRCVVTYGGNLSAGAAPTGGLQSAGTMNESPADTTAVLRFHDFHLTAAAGEPTRWQATLLVEGEPTEDGRMIQDGATTWRPTPLPLMAMTVTDDGHDGAELCGRIDQIWRAAGGVIQGSGVFDDVASPFAAEIVQKIRDRFLTGVSVDPAGCEMEIVMVMPESDGSQEDAEEAAETVGYDVAQEALEPAGEDVDYLMVYTSLVIGGATVCPVQAVANAKIDLVAAADTPPPLVAAFDATECEVAPTPIANGLSRSDVLAITHKSIDALAAAATPSAPEPVGEHLEALTASVATMQRQLDEHRSELRTAREAAEAAEVGRERELRDTVASLQAEQRATFVQAGAVLEAVDQLAAAIGDRFAAIDDKISRSLDLAERKPRQVEVKRDDKGRMVGFVEG